MIDPRTQYILHQERQNKLMAEIEQRRTAQERGGAAETISAGTIRQPWYSISQRWLKAVFNRSNPKPI